MVTVLWDNDGVLVNSEGLFFRATRRTLHQVGVELTRDTFVQYSLREGKSAFDLAADRGMSQVRIAALREERDGLYTELLRSEPLLIEGVEQTLARLQGQVKMGVVTSSKREHFDAQHEITGFLPYFDFVICREDYVNSKPHPDPYLTALREQGLAAEDCIVVEDSERGLSAATACGIRCIVVPNEWTSSGNFDTAWSVVERIDCVPGLIIP